ncbi:hypothetical protein RRG08_012139 [Elysia crispata]|uniref:Uncharacterized protein n=1 Tax=Elysia crispata TaxID=231223 RepID=A0AAE1ABT4_9GAST|nr:hypothetical protein RRG08_012139 [Elysia crispata]
MISKSRAQYAHALCYIVSPKPASSVSGMTLYHALKNTNHRLVSKWLAQSSTVTRVQKLQARFELKLKVEPGENPKKLNTAKLGRRMKEVTSGRPISHCASLPYLEKSSQISDFMDAPPHHGNALLSPLFATPLSPLARDLWQRHSVQRVMVSEPALINHAIASAPPLGFSPQR